MRGLAVILLVVLIWAGGLFAFAERVKDSTPPQTPATADGIVVLTGASSLRIEAAVRLLDDRLGKRLLVSGVNREVSRPQLQAVAHDYSRAFDCCVDLGFRAEDTQGNAKETASWARYHHYGSLIVVTADYHMPRSLLELRAAMPAVALIPYPVATDTLDARTWFRTSAGARRMVVEYSKYLVILARETVLRLGGGKRDSLVQPAADQMAPANTSS